MKKPALSASLRERGLTQQLLAEKIGSSRAHVCQVLGGVPGRGYRTRKKLVAWLTERERAMLGWDDQGRVFHVEGSKP